MLNKDELSKLLSEIQKARPGLQFDLSGTSVSDQTVKLKETGALDQSASQRTSLTLRVWNTAGRLGVVQLTSFEPNEIISAVDIALQAAPLGPEEDLPQIPQHSSAGELPTDPDLSKRTTLASIEALGHTLEKAVAELKAFHPDIQGVPYNALTQRSVERFYANTAGLVRTQESQSVSTYLYAKGQSAGHKPRAAGHWGSEIALADLKMADVVNTAAENLVARLQPAKISSGPYPIVFSGQAFLDLLGSFQNLFSAQNILDKQSLHTRDSLGQTIASELLTVTDDPLHHFNIARALFDGEGTAVRKTTLVEKGVLTGLWHHSVTAKQFATQTTGHARVGAKMTVGPWFFNVAPGAGLGDRTENCIWIEDLEALHAGVNPLQGSFSLPFQGFRIENGKKISLEGVTVAGDILALLKAIVAVDSKQERADHGVCPAIAVASLSVTCEN